MGYQRRLARALRHAGRVEEALTLAVKALEALEGGHLLFEVAAARLEEAKCLRALDLATDALLALATARAHFDILGAGRDVLHCDELRARWLHAEGRYAEATEVGRRARGQRRTRGRLRGDHAAGAGTTGGRGSS